MKEKGITALLASMAALLLAASAFAQLTVPGQQPAGQKPEEQEKTAGATQQAEEQELLSAHRLIGNTVANQKGQELGEITNFLVDPGTGQVAFVILNTGDSFIGGEDARAIPFKALEVQEENLTLDLDQQQLAKAPVWASGMTPEEFDRRAAEFFGVAPIWGEENKK